MYFLNNLSLLIFKVITRFSQGSISAYAMGEIGFPSLSHGASVKVYGFSVATEEVRAEHNRLCVVMENPWMGRKSRTSQALCYQGEAMEGRVNRASQTVIVMKRP